MIQDRIDSSPSSDQETFSAPNADLLSRFLDTRPELNLALELVMSESLIVQCLLDKQTHTASKLKKS